MRGRGNLHIMQTIFIEFYYFFQTPGSISKRNKRVEVDFSDFDSDASYEEENGKKEDEKPREKVRKTRCDKGKPRQRYSKKAQAESD